MEIKNLILDLNGTIALDGKIIDGVTARVRDILGKGIKVYLFSGDTYGNAGSLAKDLGIELCVAKDGSQKLKRLQEIGSVGTVSIGNGLIDAQVTEAVELGIIVIGREGAHKQAVLAADIVVTSVIDALELLLYPSRLFATVRP